MKANHLVTRFVSPVLLYMGIVLYFIAFLSIVGSLAKDPGFLIVGLISFVLAHNSWHFGRESGE